jgi:uncharacterized protein YjbI with pentapeptide repeats
MRSISILLVFVGPILASGFSTNTAKSAPKAPNRSSLSSSFDFDNIVKQTSLALTTFSLTLLLSSGAAVAADFAGKDLSGQDFSGQTLAGKDFSKVTASKVNFREANLQGANFKGANLIKADFSGAQLDDVKFDDALLDGTIMKDAIARRTSFTGSILDIADLENADLTNSVWPSKYFSFFVLPT